VSSIEIIAEIYADTIHWETFCKYTDINKYSFDFIDKFSDEIDWFIISVFQDLTEEFMCKYNKLIDWYSVSIYQTLSEQFVREYQHKVFWDNLLLGPSSKVLSKEFKDEFKDRFNISD